MRITSNGKEESLATEGLSVLDYLGLKGVRPETVAVEFNGTVLSKAEYGLKVMQNGDIIEIVKFVGGG